MGGLCRPSGSCVLAVLHFPGIRLVTESLLDYS